MSSLHLDFVQTCAACGNDLKDDEQTQIWNNITGGSGTICDDCASKPPYTPLEPKK